MSFTQVQLIGNVGKSPEMSYTPAGIAVTKFSLAVNKRKPGGKEQGEQGDTTWYNITAFRGLAETLNQYVEKGSQLFIQGELDVRTYTTRDGKQGFSLDVIVDKFTFVGGKKTSEPGTPASDDTDPLGDLEDHPF